MKRSQRLCGMVCGGDALRLKIVNNAMIWWMKEPQVKIYYIPNRKIYYLPLSRFSFWKFVNLVKYCSEKLTFKNGILCHYATKGIPSHRASESVAVAAANAGLW